MIGHIADWTTTALYTRIRNRAAANDSLCAMARHTLDDCMGDIQAVLQQGGTGPTDFTLHDAQHGLRVAQRMVEIVPSDVLNCLSCYELALLLLSAYLHDIGMSPSRQRVTGHYRYLLTAEPGELDGEEIDAFRQWLDLHGSEAVPPLIQGGSTGKTLGDAEWLVAHYCRERHNDWSADWIAERLPGLALGDYSNWQTDLMTICRSHHECFQQLLESRFDPVEVGSAGAVVHLRYLAAVLRLADVMENDPERTPEVVLRQRNISPSSLVYWQKDHGVSLTRTDSQYRLTARPRSALIHKAVAETACQIEQELLVCRRLADETNFSFLRGSSRPLPHRWDLSATLTTRIEPLSNTYEYIDGTFRPDIRRLLRLLGGVELYGSDLAAVRELLQNAFDAVRERIARELLLEPTDPQRAVLLGRLYSVELRLEEADGIHWLVCRDRGAGMTRAIIGDHLLVSGSAIRDDLMRLSRQCELRGFRLERTAKFGIGVLSYFMIADRVEIRTRRCQSAQAGEAGGWLFATDGVNGFGELRADQTCTEGTEVRLRLKPQLVGGDLRAFWQRLLVDLAGRLLHAPCRIHAHCQYFPDLQLQFNEPGWVRNPTDYSRHALAGHLKDEIRLKNSADLPVAEILPSEKKASEFAIKRRKETRYSDALRCIRWAAPLEGAFPEGLGRYRVLLPWFALDGGACLHYMQLADLGNGSQRIDRADDHVWDCQSGLEMSWFGMRTEFDRNMFSWPLMSLRGVVEIDWTSNGAGILEANRNVIDLSSKARQTVFALLEEAKTALSAFVEQNPESHFSFYNAFVTKGSLPQPTSWRWPFLNEDGSRKLKALRFPLVHLFDTPEREGQLAGLCWQGRRSDAFPSVCAQRSATSAEILQGDSARLQPTRIIFNSGARRTDSVTGLFRDSLIALLYENLQPGGWPRLGLPEVAFPPQWLGLCAALREQRGAFNNRHPLVLNASEEARTRLFNEPALTHDPRPYAAEFRSNRKLAATWILHAISRGLSDLLNGLSEHEPTLLATIWNSAFDSDNFGKTWAFQENLFGRAELVSVGRDG